jgi:hypothetical protein
MNVQSLCLVQQFSGLEPSVIRAILINVTEKYFGETVALECAKALRPFDPKAMAVVDKYALPDDVFKMLMVQALDGRGDLEATLDYVESLLVRLWIKDKGSVRHHVVEFLEAYRGGAWRLKSDEDLQRRLTGMRDAFVDPFIDVVEI